MKKQDNRSHLKISDHIIMASSEKYVEEFSDSLLVYNCNFFQITQRRHEYTLRTLKKKMNEIRNSIQVQIRIQKK